MGNAATSEQFHHPEDGGVDGMDEFDGIETLGYRVLGVQPNSPAAQAGLVSFFDFILGANGQMLLGSGEGLQEGEEYDDVDFPALLLEHKGQVVELLVWNIKSQEQRLVELIPNDDWGGAGLLGVTIRLDDYGGAEDRLIRVLSVEEQSPAAIAGLVPLQDYLLGTTITAFGTTEVLASVLQHHMDHVVELYVYNVSSDMVRVVALMPTYSWGGQGLLGAEVGTGYLHRLPSSAKQTIGQSVERKVRWIQNSKNEQDHATNDETDNTNTTSNAAVSSSEALLETEPHLEMEQDHTHEYPEHLTRQPYELGSHEVAIQVATTTSTSSSRVVEQPVQVAAAAKTTATTANGIHSTNNGTVPVAAAMTATKNEFVAPVQQQQQQKQQQQPTQQQQYIPAAQAVPAPMAATTNPVSTPEPVPQKPPPQQLQQPVESHRSPQEEAVALFSGPPPTVPNQQSPPPQQQPQQQIPTVAATTTTAPNAPLAMFQMPPPPQMMH